MSPPEEKELCIPRSAACGLLHEAQDALAWLLRQLEAAKATGADTAALEKQANEAVRKLAALRRLYGL
jgi:hypothetical protein